MEKLNEMTPESNVDYEKPTIEVIEMEHEGCILQSSAGKYTGGGGFEEW